MSWSIMAYISFVATVLLAATQFTSYVLVDQTRLHEVCTKEMDLTTTKEVEKSGFETEPTCDNSNNITNQLESLSEQLPPRRQSRLRRCREPSQVVVSSPVLAAKQRHRRTCSEFSLPLKS